MHSGKHKETPQGVHSIASCFQCGRPGATAKCGRCKSVFFCDVTCQKVAWPSHKPKCVPPNPAAEPQMEQEHNLAESQERGHNLAELNQEKANAAGIVYLTPEDLNWDELNTREALLQFLESARLEQLGSKRSVKPTTPDCSKYCMEQDCWQSHPCLLHQSLSDQVRVPSENIAEMHSGKHKETPQVHSIASCFQCGRPGATAKCGRCKSVFFCDVTCQKVAWPSHKPKCVPPNPAAEPQMEQEHNLAESQERGHNLAELNQSNSCKFEDTSEEEDSAFTLFTSQNFWEKEQFLAKEAQAGERNPAPIHVPLGLGEPHQISKFCAEQHCWQSLPCLLHQVSKFCTEQNCWQSVPCLLHQVKCPHLSSHSRAFLINVAGFLESKQAMDATALAVLPRRWMDEHASFTDDEGMVQKGLQGTKVQTLDELFVVAQLALSNFSDIMRKMVTESNLNPDEEVKLDGQLLMLDHHTVFRVLSLAPLKSKARCSEKVLNEYGGDFSRLVDVVRCSIVVYTEKQLEAVAQGLSPKKPHLGYTVVRLKNRFKQPLFNGYRDALYSIRVECGGGVFHVCEVQLHLAAIVAHKESSHHFYEYFRAYFSGSGEEQTRMAVLSNINKFGQDVDRMVAFTLSGSDLPVLEDLAKLVEKYMGDIHLTAVVRKRILELKESLSSNFLYAHALYNEGKLEEAETQLRRLNEEHPFHFAVINELTVVLTDQAKLEEAEARLRQVLTSTQHQPHQPGAKNHLMTLVLMNNLAMVLKDRGKLVEAERLFRECLDGLQQQGEVGNIRAVVTNLGIVLQDQGKYAEAEPLYRKVLLHERKHKGNAHPDTLCLLGHLASLLAAQGKLLEAEPLAREVVLGRKQHLGNHPRTYNSLANLAGLLHQLGKLDEAAAVCQEAIEGHRRHLGSTHPKTLDAIGCLGLVRLEQGKLKEAEPLLQEALSGNLEKWGFSHPRTATSHGHVASLLHRQGKHGEAVMLYRAALAGMNPTHPHTLTLTSELGTVLHAQGELEEAEMLFQKSLSTARQQLSDAHPRTLVVMTNLASLLADVGREAEAERLYREALLAGVYLGKAHITTTGAKLSLAQLLQFERPEEAENLLQEVILEITQIYGGAHPYVEACKKNLRIIAAVKKQPSIRATLKILWKQGAAKKGGRLL